GRIEAVDSDGHLRSCPSDLGGVAGGRGTRSSVRLAGSRRIRVGSWNVGSLTRKLFELGDALGRHKVDIACFQETKWKGSRAREGNGYKLWYSGSSTARNGVGIILNGRLKDNVVRVTRRSDRIMAISVVIEGETVIVISAYAPQVGLSDADKKRFWDALDELVRECPTDQRLIIGGDLNGHIGAAADGYAGVHGGFGFGDRNEEGCTILEFATAHDLVVANSFFKKSDAHLITFQSGGHNTQIDYLLVRRGDLKACKDCRAFPGEACSSQHRLIIVDVLLERLRHRREETGRPRILWKNLNGEAVETFRAIVSEKLAVEDMSASNADQMWNTLARVMKDAAKDSLGVANESARTHSTHRESWWFCEEVQTKVATKQSRFIELLSCREGNQEDIDTAKERYKAAKREAKIAVAKAKDKAYEDLRDIGNVRYIKDEGGRPIMREKDIRKRWGEYFSSIFNETPSEKSRPDGSGEVECSCPPMHYDCYYSRINQGEVSGRQGGEVADVPFQQSAKMPDEWRLSEVIPIYKNKGDAQSCSNYRGIKLLSHAMKLWERVIERRLRRETRVSENQFGFMPRRSTTEAIHLLRSLIEKYRERQRDLHIAFLDLEKAYDSVPRELVWKTLLDKGTPRRYSRVIKDMYEGGGGKDPRTDHNGEHRVFPSGNDIVLIAESAKGLNNRLESWMKALEDNGLRVSREKTEYLRCDFGRYKVVHQEMDIRIGDQILQPKESLDEMEGGFRSLCDTRIPLKIKGKFYKAAIRPAMLYSSKCWPITKALANKVEVAELRMLRWTCGKTMVDMIPNEVFRAELDVDSIIDKMREGRGRPKLRWEYRLKMDMKELRLSEDMTSDRNAWRDRIRISGCDWCVFGAQCSGWVGCMLHRRSKELMAGWMAHINHRMEGRWLVGSGGSSMGSSLGLRWQIEEGRIGCMLEKKVSGGMVMVILGWGAVVCMRCIWLVVGWLGGGSLCWSEGVQVMVLLCFCVGWLGVGVSVLGCVGMFLVGVYWCGHVVEIGRNGWWGGIGVRGWFSLDLVNGWWGVGGDDIGGLGFLGLGLWWVGGWWFGGGVMSWLIIGGGLVVGWVVVCCGVFGWFGGIVVWGLGGGDGWSGRVYGRVVGWDLGCFRLGWVGEGGDIGLESLVLVVGVIGIWCGVLLWCRSAIIFWGRDVWEHKSGWYWSLDGYAPWS
ncbi:retrovirus-related pol polyprotein LINE-1, partial [Tanacetum coccineum]